MTSPHNRGLIVHDVCRDSWAASPWWTCSVVQPLWPQQSNCVAVENASQTDERGQVVVVFIVPDAVLAVKGETSELTAPLGSGLSETWQRDCLKAASAHTPSVIDVLPTSRAPFSLCGRRSKSFHVSDIENRFINNPLDEKYSDLVQSICVTTEM